MKRAFVFTFLVFSGCAIAETAPPPSVGGAVTPSPIQPGSSSSLGVINALDNNFFNSNPSSISNTPPGLSPKGRVFDADPDYNSAQREEWLRKCEPYKDQDSKLFRECFQREKDKMRLELREKFDSVERRQGNRLKSYYELLKPNSNSGGFD